MRKNKRELFSVGTDERNYDSLFYQKRIHEFTETFSAASLLPHRKDALSAYLVSVMEQEGVRQLMMQSKVGTRIFIDTMMDFVTLYLKKMHYLRQRWGAEEREIQEAENWSGGKIENGWRTLVDELEKRYGEQGFTGHFYTKEIERENGEIEEGLWQNLLEEWHRHFELRFAQQRQQFVRERGSAQLQLLLNNLAGVKEPLSLKSITEKDFNQTWALMGGHWNTLVFDRLYQTTLLQKRYPVLQQIAERMGKKSDRNGTQRIATTSGRSEQLAHTSKSDIAGISTGRDLGALLPSEMALFMDPSTEEVFLHKYVSNRLQVFEHQSKMLHAARSLHTESATHKGPIVVCVDTSGSMTGEPRQIALSQMMRLAEMSDAENRRCFLIAFSVHAQAIDVLLDRTQLLQFFTHQATGDTDARRMMEVLFELLQSNADYTHADVLWISDFRIPIPPATYLQQMERLQKTGTHFYGLQMGIAENRWRKYFDEIFAITDVRMSIV